MVFEMRTSLSILLLATLGTVGCATVPDEREPRAYYEQQDNAEARRQTEKATEDNSIDAIGSYFQLLGDRMNNTTPIQLARLMEDQTSADNRRQGINGLVKRPFGQHKPYTTRYGEIAVGIPTAGTGSDADYVVRATAVRALNRSRDKASTSVFITALSDRNELVRLEAVKALNNVPDDAAVPRLIQMVVSPSEALDVRVAAAEALRHYKTLEVARTLIGVLGERDFGISWQARRSLNRLTNTDMGYDQGKWLTYLTGPTNPFG